MMLTRSGTIAVGLVLLNVLLLAVLVYEFFGLNVQQAQALAPAAETSSEIPLNPPEPVEHRSINDYDVMLVRPLFNKDRLPLDKDDSDAAAADASAFSLIGVVLTPEQQVAIIYSKNQVRQVKVPLWDWVDGWRLIEIEAQGVILRKANRSLELSLQRTSQAQTK
jgi:hypothetical protein